MRSPEPPAGRPEETRFDPPRPFLGIARTLEQAGYQAWAVGGAIRDSLLGEGAGRADWDLATDARPEEVQTLFPRTVPIGIEHGTVGVLASDATLVEVTTFRRDVETDGRHAVVRFAESIEEDLGRRDFTINALAWRPSTGVLRDPFGGADDLEARVLRAVGDPAARFAEDHLRVLRGLRFAGRLALRVEEETRRALEGAVGWLDRLSAERVREELMKVLAGPVPSRALAWYGEVGALHPWHRELEPVAARARAWETTRRAVDEIGRHRPVLRLARLLVPIGDEPEARRRRGEELLGRLKFSNDRTARVRHLLEHYEPLVGPVDSSARVRQWLAEVGPSAARDLFRLHFATARASGEERACRYLREAWRSVHDRLLEHPPLRLRDLAIDGSDLLGLGLPQGPLIGLYLEELHARVLEDPDRNDREALLAEARDLIEMAGLGHDGPAAAGTDPGAPDPDGGAGSRAPEEAE